MAGRTDSTGSNAVNLRLSEQRAQNVARLLTGMGDIPVDIVTADGYGF